MRDQEIPAIEIRVAQDAESLWKLHPDPGLGSFFRYVPSAAPRTFETLGHLLKHGGKAFLACLGDTVVGYVVIAPAGTDQPWGREPGLTVREVSVEIAREWRGQRLARRLFETLVADPDVEDQILVATAYRWCWDPGQTAAGRSDEAAYGQRVYGLFAAVGFTRRATNDINIAMDPLNFLAVRVGERVPAEQRRRFDAALFAVRAA